MDNDAYIPHVVRTQEIVHALLIGAGRGGIAMMELFEHYDWLHLVGVVDKDDSAPGLAYARLNQIPVYSEFTEALEHFNGTLIFDVTGDKELAQTMQSFISDKNVEVISGETARLIYGLTEDQIRNQELIHTKTSHLHLLNAMMQISQELKNHSGEESMLQEALHGSARLLISQKAAAIEYKETELEIIGGMGVDIPESFLRDEEIITFIELIRKQQKDNLLIQLSPSLKMPGTNEEFQVAVPLYINQELRYVLLFQIDFTLTEEIQASLILLISHLQLALEAESHTRLLQELAYKDPLTGVYNRRFFDERLIQEIDRLTRASFGSLTLMFFDLDYFKEFNDSFGHDIGDKILQTVASTIHGQLRSYDVLARYGGDEFIAILTGFQANAIQPVANRILASVTNTDLSSLGGGLDERQLGISIGVAIARPGLSVDSEKFISLADQALYTAKQGGRGQVKVINYHEA
ncbi:MAG: GGDEF domain-containing protein [Gammaproteobacteria bacterium]